MVAPLIVAGAISAGAQLASTGIAANQGDSGSFSRERADTWLTRRVQDARNAGLHPLFALGAGGSSPTYSSTGSNLGDGVARAGQAVAEGVRGFTADRRNQKLDDMAALESSARISKLNTERKLDEILIMQKWSDLAMAENTAKTGARMNPDGSVVVPAHAVSPGGIPLPSERPTSHEPNITSPGYMTYIDDEGNTRRLYHKDMQADELNQIRLAKHEGGNAWQKMKRWIVKQETRGTRYRRRRYSGGAQDRRERYYGRTYPRGY